MVLKKAEPYGEDVGERANLTDWISVDFKDPSPSCCPQAMKVLTEKATSKVRCHVCRDTGAVCDIEFSLLTTTLIIRVISLFSLMY